MKKLSSENAEVLSTWMSSDDVRAAVESIRSASTEDTGTFRMVITTENLDRYQEVISLDGWELDHYLSSPVVLWGHDHYTPPVAVTDKLIKEGGKLIAEGRFAPTELGQELRKLYDLGFLKASSVGFIEKERQGNLITKAELIEWSFVSVPANPYALSLALEKELSINELVTKGFMEIEHSERFGFIVKTVDTVPEKSEDEDTPEEPEPEPEDTPEPVEKSFTNKSLTPIVEQLRAALGALEALDTEEPERTEDEPVADEVDDEAEALKAFNEKRRTIQQAATLIGEILAEQRQEAEALRKSK
jgi:phage head maturation protease